jgi:nicotinate-nucleotide--dimethylbenzimidazole phosphoribosyltransferase
MSEEDLTRLVEAVERRDDNAARVAQQKLDSKTKPPGSLGELERLAVMLAAARGSADPGPLRAAVVVAAADHGVADEGVSAYPQRVTRQMLGNFAAGGAAVSVLARAAGASLIVVDAGVAGAGSQEDVRSLRLGDGTSNLARGAAMSREDALAGVLAGSELARELAAEGFGLLALGEMGIGNTTTASALCSALLPAAPCAVCGRGTGIDDATLARKRAIVARALEVNRPDPRDPVGVLARLGGFELAVLVGLCLGGAARRLVLLLDGFVTGAAALVAARLARGAVDFMIAAHRSPEPGHDLVLSDLGLRPLLDLGLRLGEGSGAALALPLVHAARALLVEMATFESAGIDAGG